MSYHLSQIRLFKVLPNRLKRSLIIAVGLGFMSFGSVYAVEWRVGFNKSWSTAVGEIKPEPDALEIIEAAKDGLFATPDDAAEWEVRVLGFMGTGLMTGRSSKVFLAPGIGLPAKQMSAEQFADVTKLLAEWKGLPGEKVLAYISDGDEQFELWTTECIYAYGYGGGMSRVEKTRYGWSYADMMFDGEKQHLEVLRFWDLALSNNTMEEVKGPKGSEAIGQFVKLFLERTIAPKATTTVFATIPRQTDRVLAIQNNCRRFLSARIVRALQKNKTMFTKHNGYRSAEWGGSFTDTSRLLMPFLSADDSSFFASRLTPDIALLYGNHFASTNAIAKTIKAELWPSVLKLDPHQVASDKTEELGLKYATSHFAGRADRLSEFFEITGIPVAPDFDYWSYATPAGRYTAWFIDDQFYAMEIEPSKAAANYMDAVMQDLTNRYGAFTDRHVKTTGTSYSNKRFLIHEDSDGGTLVMYEPTTSEKKYIKRIYHYSLKMRPMVNAKMSASKADADKKAAQDEASAAKKASQF
jgi:hypothetical protein